MISGAGLELDEHARIAGPRRPAWPPAVVVDARRHLRRSLRISDQPDDLEPQPVCDARVPNERRGHIRFGEQRHAVRDRASAVPAGGEDGYSGSGWPNFAA